VLLRLIHTRLYTKKLAIEYLRLRYVLDGLDVYSDSMKHEERLLLAEHLEFDLEGNAHLCYTGAGLPVTTMTEQNKGMCPMDEHEWLAEQFEANRSIHLTQSRATRK
jgi:hypothetical protein